MLLKRSKGWEIPESRVTDPGFVLGRRRLLAGAVSATIAAPMLAASARAAPNPKYDAGRALTAERDATTYNNYYEFGTDKSIWRAAQKLPQRPWSIEITGLADKPGKLALDDLLKTMPIEERVYRHRCVEAWAMTVPWTGFPLAALLGAVQPKPEAKYVIFETVQDEKTMPGLGNPLFTWPYIEAVTMAEARNDLAFMVTGLYGKPCPPQNGGPIRLALPWKYGFKSCKSIGKITFAAERPDTFWHQIQPSEYGFWANVNPAVAHPRWSQATERLLGSGDIVPSVIYNGYGPFVADMYADVKGEELYR